MTKTQNKWLLIILMTITLTVGVIFLAGDSLHSPDALGISFCCITNVPSHEAVEAQFIITNKTSESIDFRPCHPRTQMGGIWTAISDSPVVLTLHAHATESWACSVPTNYAVWQLPVAWYYNQPSKFEIFRGNLAENILGNIRRLRNGQGLQHFNGSLVKSYIAFSETITNK